MPFLPLQPCCLRGQILPGTPMGIMEPPSGTRAIKRYHARPKGHIFDEHAAVVLFYDVFGFNIVCILLFLLHYFVSIPDGSLSPILRSWRTRLPIILVSASLSQITSVGVSAFFTDSPSHLLPSRTHPRRIGLTPCWRVYLMSTRTRDGSTRSETTRTISGRHCPTP